MSAEGVYSRANEGSSASLGPKRSESLGSKHKFVTEDSNDLTSDANDSISEGVVLGKKRYFGFLRSRRFYLIVFIGQVLSLSITCTNTLTTYLSDAGASFPALQSFFNYFLLFVIFTPYTIYRMGFKNWCKLVYKDGWKFFILAFADVEGNYFVVMAYRYTNILSAALLDNFAIVVVVVLSFFLLKVRYHWSQYLGIVGSIGGMALLCVSDHLTDKDYGASDMVKGDLFVLLGAACYGISNTWEEYFVSKRPLYVVLGQLGMWASFISGVQTAIFDRDNIRNSTWDGKVAGYLVGYTATLFMLYNTAPILFRMSSAAFYNLSLLTSDFWSLCVGIEVFGYTVYWLYPVGFVLVVLGIICYCAAPMTEFGESFKPWLGDQQEQGIAGLGTARLTLNNRKMMRNADVEAQIEEAQTSDAEEGEAQEATAHERS